MGLLNHIWTLKPILVTIIAFIAPIVLLVDYSEDFEVQSKCAYVIVVMAILWLTEAIPIPVTSLMPIFLFPLLGVAKAKDISSAYVTDTTMLFFGGLIIAVALEETGLHTRISLCVMMLVGAQPIFLMAGLMVTTWFLSMWISNTAATSMMIPIITAVIKTVSEVRTKTLYTADNPAFKDDDSENGVPKDKIDVSSNGDVMPESESNKNSYKVSDKDIEAELPEEMDDEMKRYAKAFALCVAYGANIGGIATLTGTPPNLVLKENADELYSEAGYKGESEISFAKWMGFAFPLSLLTAVIGWLWLILCFIRCGCCKKMDPEQKKAVNATIRAQFKSLGFLTLAELQVLIVFIILVILWLFRNPPNIDGWGDISAFKPGYVSDSTPCMLLSVLLFLLPREVPQIFCLLKEGLPSYKPILTWQAVSAKLPWGVIILLGGGFAIAKASKDSGLSLWLGNQLSTFDNLDNWVLNLLVCVIVAGATEVTSNTATATLLMPILAELGIATEIHPLYLMMSATVACSFAFMLPVATPPNAIVFSTGYLTIPDMALAGLPMNIIAVLCLTFAINTWGKSMYDLDEFPEIFLNQTAST
ncbi:solute carrier family 13 member 2-like [Ruditapes philippinarum]|uniref:solute carrier family 13 member 2-like n=1 Tax=Ruditapes philippinarum TaxID=129788 RepID=UPI00295AF3F9|nr:solute carrier family 13 member 2-like [Ruditapes philippinarum]XP_060587394.1 solute carrier family 13 member 2-like [Ruditapes philippinarum]